jgi:outer membrane protein assembly factor BamB
MINLQQHGKTGFGRLVGSGTGLALPSVRRLLPLLVAVVSATCLTGADWLQFRGNDVSGVSALSEIPATWSDTENIAWKVDLPGRGLSGAIVIGDQVVVTASSGFRQDRLHILSFDRASGKKIWERQFWATGRTMTHPKMCVATPTPASDGERIFAFYSSNDVVCLDLDGNLQWLRGLTHDFPNASNSLGMASSPIVIGDTLIVQVENDAESFATGLDTSNGKARWKKVRPKKANWSSPTLWQNGDAEPVALLQSSAGIEAVAPSSGETLWTFGDGASTIPSSVVVADSLLVPSNGLTALRLAEKLDADAKSPEVLWNDNRLGPGTSSPIVVNGIVFVVNRAGVLQAADVSTGSILWKVRLKGPFSATPVAAGKHLIFFNEEGGAQVVDISGAEGQIVGENSVGETILSTPAIADNEMFVRSDGHLWKIAK